MNILKFLRNWTLPISMGIGVSSYFLLAHSTAAKPYHPTILRLTEVMQPILIFSMLFVSFCKIRLSELRFSPWQWKLLLLQGSVFLVLGGMLAVLPKTDWSVLLEAGMLCFICPTATAAIVVAGKLGGNTGTLTTYTILGNLSTALLVPLMIPVIHPGTNASLATNTMLIMKRVFPLLFCPFVLSLFLQAVWPKAVKQILRVKDLAFHMWTVALALAMGITTRSLVHSTFPVGFEIGIAAVSLVACATQFYVGRRIGLAYHDATSSAQAIGQKNTIFAIWLGYTFLTPVTSLAGGFYSIWHNIYNSYQLYQKEKETQPRK